MGRIKALSCLLAVLAVACVKEEPAEQIRETVPMTISAGFEGSGTKTYVYNGSEVWWNSTKHYLYVFDSKGYKNNFSSDCSKGTVAKADFTGEITAGSKVNFVYYSGLAPSKDSSYLDSDGKIRGTVITDQYPTNRDSFGASCNIAIMKGDSSCLKNILGYIKMTLPIGLKSSRIYSVTVSADENLKGDIEIDPSKEIPTVRIIDNEKASKSITIKPRWYGKKEVGYDGGDLYLCIPPGTYHNMSFTITPFEANGKEGTLAGGKIGTTGCTNTLGESFTIRTAYNIEVVRSKYTDAGTLPYEDPGTKEDTILFNAKNRALLNTFLEEYLSVKGKAAAADEILASQQADGSWSDINYKDQARSNWDATKHISRIVTLACAYHVSKDKKYHTAIAKALDYWASTKPTCTNWWYNEINMPKTLGPAMLLIRTDLTKSMLEDVIYVMDKATISKTGQNLVWLAGNVLMNAILKRDGVLARQAHAAMIGEITVIPEGTIAEGIQYDWSFHQHGAQLQFGNYGHSFVTEFANWFKAWKGTCLEVTGEKLEIMQNYVYNGLEWVFWKGYFDHSACGRQVIKNAQISKYNNAARAIQKMGLELRSPVGARYYPKSDFGVYRTTDWYASVRMHSTRTIGYETTNSENMKGFFSADGATLVRRNGDEYYDVSAVWDWRHIPGVTCYNTEKALSSKYVANDTPLVFGTTSGNYMAIGMKLKRNSLAAKKAWFFCPEGYVCLGAGITMSKGYDVTTAVEQCLMKATGVDSTKTWIRHNDITYVPIGETTFKIAPAAHSGDWADIHPTSSSPETKNLLDIYIDHGVNPSKASYSYLIVPTGVSGETAAAYIGTQVKVLSNTESEQKVSIFGKTMTVTWGDDAHATIE